MRSKGEDPTLSDVIDALREFWIFLVDHKYYKIPNIAREGERAVLRPLYFFLAGRFGTGRVERESDAKLPGARSGKGRVDFRVSSIAIELVVRRPGESVAHVLPAKNTTEVRKLLKHDGRAVLVLMDLSKSPCSAEELEARYRNWREECGIGRGNHDLSTFNVLYCSRMGETWFTKFQVRAGSSSR